MARATTPPAKLNVTKLNVTKLNVTKPEPAPQPSGEQTELTLRQAAQYTGLTESGIKRYIYVTKELQPVRRVAQVQLFSRDDLDRINATRRRRGWPKGKKRKRVNSQD